MSSLLLLNNFDRVISWRRVQKKRKATNYCFGHSLWSANQASMQGVEQYWVLDSLIKRKRTIWSDTYLILSILWQVSRSVGRSRSLGGDSEYENESRKKNQIFSLWKSPSRKSSLTICRVCRLKQKQASTLSHWSERTISIPSYQRVKFS